MPWRSATRRRRGRSFEQASALRRGETGTLARIPQCAFRRGERAQGFPQHLDLALIELVQQPHGPAFPASLIVGEQLRGKLPEMLPRMVEVDDLNRTQLAATAIATRRARWCRCDTPPSVSPSRRLPDPTCPSWASRPPTFMSCTFLNSSACENLTGCDTFRYHEPAGWSSLVARWAHNPKVAGSNPAPATNP